MNKLKKADKIIKNITLPFAMAIAMIVVSSLKIKDYETALFGIVLAMLLVTFVVYREKNKNKI